MKILLIHQYYLELDGAGGTRFNDMTKIWKRFGHDITVISGNLSNRGKERKNIYNGKLVTKTVQENIVVFRCYVSKLYNVNFLGRLWGYFSFVFSSIFAGLFKTKGKYDLILATSPPLFVGITAYFISIIKRIPFVFEVRDLWPESAIDTGILKNSIIIKYSYLFEAFIYRKALLINVLTPAFYQNLINNKNVSDKKIIIIPNASDFSIADELHKNFNAKSFRKKIGFNNHHFIIIYVGAHGIANGLNHILKTANRLKDTNVIFLLIGDGMKKQELISIANKMSLQNIRFFDPVPKKEILKYILASDMGVSVLIKNPTFKTIYSNKTFDYMACKKPIFMAIDGISRELILEADAGVFVEPENDFDFEKKIRYYLNNSDEVIRQGENGYKYAKQHFDRELLAIKYIEKLSKLT